MMNRVSMNITDQGLKLPPPFLFVLKNEYDLVLNNTHTLLLLAKCIYPIVAEKKR